MKGNKAVVVGAGFAGLVAARVLSDHFRSVVVIDKDDRVGSSTPRRGVAQGAHLHVLLKRGQEILRALFPEIEQIFERAHCPKIDWAADTNWESETGIFPRYSSNMKTYSFSRPFLEGAIYSLVSERTNVTFVRSHVEKLIVENDLARNVQGEGLDFDETADMVVVAGGQNFPFNRLLEYQKEDPTEHVPIQITYRSVVFATESLNFEGFKQYYYQLAAPHDPIGAVICPIEDGRSVATIVEYGPPQSIKTDLDGFMKMAERVPEGKFFEILRQGKSLTDVSVFHKPSMYMRRPDKLSQFPENVFCMGDVFCSLNPVFGQGMTSALIQAKVLDEHLRSSNLDSKSFHRKSAGRLRLPFLLSKMGSNTQQDFSYRYLRAYLVRCQESPEMHRKFLGTLHLENSYGSLFDVTSLGSALSATLLSPFYQLRKS